MKCPRCRKEMSSRSSEFKCPDCSYTIPKDGTGLYIPGNDEVVNVRT